MSISFWEASFLWRDPLLAAALGALLCAHAGVYVVLKRSAFVGAAVSQASSLGVVAALLLPHLVGWSFPPLLAGLLAGVGAASLFALSPRRERVGMESTIALAYVLAGAGALLLGTLLTHEYEQVHSLLFGDVVAADRHELYALAVTLFLVAGMHGLLGRRFLFASFDPETARAMGLRVRRLNALLYGGIGLSLAVATRALGALPVFALTVIPAAGGLLLFLRLRWVFAWALGSAVAAAAVGYYLSFVWDLPTGAAIVGVSGCTLLPGLLRRLLRPAE